MKVIRFSLNVHKKLQIIKTKDQNLYKRIQKQLKLFREDPKRKSLRLHKVTREIKNSWSISIDKSFRMIYTELDESVYFFDIGTHDEVYKKK